MKFYQFNCAETNQIDLTQANAILEHRPDIIFFEAPMKNDSPETIFNNFPAEDKPIDEINKIKENLLKWSKKFGYLLSDIETYNNIVRLWERGQDIKLYNIDAPNDLLAVNVPAESDSEEPKPEDKSDKNLFWWIRIYLREKIMTKNIKLILEQFPNDEDLIALVFLQSFHWEHVQFLMQNPSADEIWEYYFADFPGMTKKEIKNRVEKGDAVYFKYWQEFSDFK